MKETSLQNLKTPIAVVGLGKSGQAAHDLLLASGYSKSNIITFDEKSSTAQLHSWSDLLNIDARTWVVSPGVSLQLPTIQEARKRGVTITSEISLACAYLDTEKLIGITGSVGKSTVTSLLGAGAVAFDRYAFVGGNLGTPLCIYALEKLKTGISAQWVILELSSYQLENCHPLQLDISIITYLSANHLERYSSLEEYYKTKLHIIEITKQLCVMNKTSTDIQKYAAQASRSIFLTNAEIYSKKYIMPQLMMIGSHNRDNFAMAAEVARFCQWPEESFQAMSEYRGLPHRLEFVGHIKNVSYINDSKATAIDSVLVAVQACLEGVGTGNKLFVLIGGQDKNLPWIELKSLISLNLVVPVFFGQCGEFARAQSGLTGEYFAQLGHAIEYCQKRAQGGDVVLLSPGGTSLDEFKNFEERGHFFKSLVLTQPT